MENSIEFFLNTHLEWSLSRQDLVITLLQQQGSRVEVARPQVFSGRMEEVSAFVNAAHLYIRMKMIEEAAATQVALVLSYMQGGIAEA